MQPADVNRPLRVFDKAIQGGLGYGNIGVIMSRHGTGKVAVLTSIAIDRAMDGLNTLHVAVGKSVSDVRAFHDEVLHEIITSLHLPDASDYQTKVERHKQIYTYQDGTFSPGRLRETLAFLAEHADFRPEMLEMQGWPDFQTLTVEEMQELKEIALENKAEIWLTAHTTRQDTVDPRGVPDFVARHEDFIAVLIALEPEADQVNLRFIKTHDEPPPENAHLSFCPKTMLIRWQ